MLRRSKNKYGVRGCQICVWGDATPRAVKAYFEKQIRCWHVKCGDGVAHDQSYKLPQLEMCAAHNDAEKTCNFIEIA